MFGSSFLRFAHSRPTKRCERCSLRYPADMQECPHCAHLEDGELQLLKRKVREGQEANARLGRFMFALAIALFVIIVAYGIFSV